MGANTHSAYEVHIGHILVFGLRFLSLFFFSFSKMVYVLILFFFLF